MAATARAIENVGAGAFLSAAMLLTDPQLLNMAAGILPIEVQYQTILTILTGGTVIPAFFDVALTPPQVLAIVGAFIDATLVLHVSIYHASVIVDIDLYFSLSGQHSLGDYEIISKGPSPPA